MRIRVFLLALLPGMLAVSACSSSSTQPSVIAPTPLQPANGAQITNANQPITLVIGNSVTTGTSAVTYTFEVATDAQFAAKVFTNSNVAQGSGQTAVHLGTLNPGATYYWHAGVGTTGVFSQAFTFTIGAAAVLGAPALAGPANGTATSGWPTLSVYDATRSGPVGAVTYRFDVAANSSFSQILVSGTVAETPGQTNYQIPANLSAPPAPTVYWRVTALDQADSITSASSPAWTFSYSGASAAGAIAAQEGVALWPGVLPPGTPGNAQLGGGWSVQYLTSYLGVTFLSPSLDTLQLFDLLDRGMDPQSAINWMHANGYPTAAAFYPCPGGNCSKPAIGTGNGWQYMALDNGVWDLILRAGA